MQDQYVPADVVKSTFRRLRSKPDNKVGMVVGLFFLKILENSKALVTPFEYSLVFGLGMKWRAPGWKS